MSHPSTTLPPTCTTSGSSCLAVTCIMLSPGWSL
jgi:hypothetical protein